MKINKESLQSLLKSENIMGLLVTNSVNKYYLTGFDSIYSYVLISKKNTYLIVPHFIYHSAKINSYQNIIVEKYNRNPFELLLKILICEGIKVLGFEEEYLSYKKWNTLSKYTSDLFILQPVTHLVENLRVIKSADEIQIIEKATKITEEAISTTVKSLEYGMTEIDIEKSIEKEMYKLGADNLPYRLEVSTGLKTSHINSKPSNKAVKSGELLLIDAGIIYKNYATDIARTFAITEPTPVQEFFYKIVYEFLQEVGEKLKPGVSVKDISNFSEEYFKSVGFKNYQTPHDIGHGIGFEVHERPFLSVESNELLKEGMVISIEPGVYSKKLGGIRLEEVVLITRTGCKFLSHCNDSIPIVELQ